MTAEQYQRWRDFSIRLAKYGHPKLTQQRINRAVGRLEYFFDEYIPQYYNLAEIVDWDNGKYCVHTIFYDCFGDYFHYDKWENEIGNFGNLLHCCIRSGVDMATAGGPGVLGYFAEDIRRMYQGQVPDWVKECYLDFDGLKDEQVMVI